MYTSKTIEPRLIALLNDEQSYLPLPPHSLELPPLQDPNVLKAAGRPPPLPLEPDASTRNGSTKPLGAQHNPLIAPIGDRRTHSGEGCVAIERALGDSSPQSIRKILDDDVQTGPMLSSKKRHISDNSKDDFVQLPKPAKKQKSAKQLVPPIIIGLFEPPPQATLFPPMAASSFHDSHGRNTLNTTGPISRETKETREPIQEGPPSIVEKEQSSKEATKATNTSAKKDVKPRRKWTEGETDHMFLGVHKYGVGNWTQILNDPAYSFNKRTAFDLKDRFRTCCPEELRNQSSKPKHVHKSDDGTSTESLPGIIGSTPRSLHTDIETRLGTKSDHGNGSSTPETAPKPRAHRKKLEDLDKLGIDGPFRKSTRRERRPFSEQEDADILEGIKAYGTAWSQILKDPRFRLHNRRATDLRDRVRNKFTEKAFEEAKETHILSTMGKEPAISMLSSSMNRPSSSRECLKIQEIITRKDDYNSINTPLLFQSAIPPIKDLIAEFTAPPEQLDSLSFSQLWCEPTVPFSSSIGEMDISRFLLDSTWEDSAPTLTVGKRKTGFTAINEIMNTPDQGPFENIFGEQMAGISTALALDQEQGFGGLEKGGL